MNIATIPTPPADAEGRLFPTTSEDRAKVATTVIGLVSDENPKTQLNAARLAIEMEKVNLVAERSAEASPVSVSVVGAVAEEFDAVGMELASIFARMECGARPTLESFRLIPLETRIAILRGPWGPSPSALARKE